MTGPSHKPKWFRALVGRRARHALTQTSNCPSTFQAMLGASGGPRWIGLVGIDRCLSKFLRTRKNGPRLPLIGASSGAWRMAAMCADQSGQAYDHLLYEYIEQRYHGTPTPAEISEVCRTYLARVFSAERRGAILHNPAFQLTLTTAMLKNPRPSKFALLWILILSYLLNAWDRRLLSWIFQRGLFSSGAWTQGAWDELKTSPYLLNDKNLLGALLASGSIPLVLKGENELDGSSPGLHLDGGIIDYHFQLETPGPILYPHFSDDLIPGWLDRFPPLRRISQAAKDNLCLIIPSDALIARYPKQEFPCRQHFHRYSNDERITMWTAVSQENVKVEKELTACLEANDLLRVAEPF